MIHDIQESSIDSATKRLAIIREDPWEFLRAVRTLDPSDKVNPIKAFPIHLEYLKLYTRVWQKKPKLLVPKSRRMKMSWINIALYTWEMLYHEGRHIAFVSKKEEDSNEIVKKAHFIIKNLDPKFLPIELIPESEIVYNKLSIPKMNSVIQGFPSGADQLRQYTFSGILADEMAFWDNAEQMYSASLPTLEGGGKFTGVSTAAPGFFKALVQDDLDGDGSGQRKNIKYPIKGVEIWDNGKNGFATMQIHYSADPAKVDPVTSELAPFMRDIKQSMPLRRWNQEYEVCWDSYDGMPVFPDWDTELHGVKKDIEPKIGLPLLLGFDFGLTPACLVCQIQEDVLYVLREFTAFNMGAERFMSWITPQLKTLYPRWSDLKRDYLCFLDPSGFARKDTDEKSCALVINKAGFAQTVPGVINWEERRMSVEHFLVRRSRKGGNFQVSLPNCPILVRGFQGGYRYAGHMMDAEPNKVRPLKDAHSHIHDALQMVCSKVLMPRTSSGVPVPRPHFSWAQ